MSGRQDSFGRAVTRHLTSVAGIPDLTWDFIAHEIDAPHPYSFPVRTDRKYYRILHDARRDSGMTFVVSRHGSPTVREAIAFMTLENFTPLLKAHYEAEVLPRIMRGET